MARKRLLHSLTEEEKYILAYRAGIYYKKPLTPAEEQRAHELHIKMYEERQAAEIVRISLRSKEEIEIDNLIEGALDAAVYGRAGKPKEARVNMSGTTIPIGLAKKIASYTAEQLQDFESHIIGGIEYGINVRGDVVDIDGNFVGHYNYETKKLTKGTVRPSDWNSVIAMD